MHKALKSHSFIGCFKGIRSFSCDIAFLFPEGETGDTDGGVGRAGLLGNKDTPESLKRYKLNGKFLLVLAREGRCIAAACQGQKCSLPGNRESTRFQYSRLMETCVPLCTALGAKELCKKMEEDFYWCKHYGKQF